MKDDEAELENVAIALPMGVATVLREESTWVTPPVDLWWRVQPELDLPSAKSASATSVRTKRGFFSRPLLAAAAAVPLALVGASGYLLGVSQDDAEPDHLFALEGTELQPGSSAEGMLRRTGSGLEITLDITGLPPAPPNSFYQGWLKADNGAVTIGTFHARGGAEDIVLWSGVEDVTIYRTITITLQSLGGGPASSGKVLLTGQLHVSR